MFIAACKYSCHFQFNTNEHYLLQGLCHNKLYVELFIGINSINRVELRDLGKYQRERLV